MADSAYTASSPEKANPLCARELFNDLEFQKLSIQERNKVYLERVHASAKASKSTIILMNKPDCEICTPEGDICTLSEYGLQMAHGDGVFWVPEGSTLTIRSPTACNMALDPAGDQTLEQNPGLTVRKPQPVQVEDVPEDDAVESDPFFDGLPLREDVTGTADVPETNGARAGTTTNYTTQPLYVPVKQYNSLGPLTAFQLATGQIRNVYFDDFMALNGRFFPEHKVLLNKDINMYCLRHVLADGVTIIVHAQVLALYFPALDDANSAPAKHVRSHFDGFTVAALILAFYHMDRQDISMDHIVSPGKLRNLFQLWVHWNPQLDVELIHNVWDTLNNWVCRL